MATWRVAGDRAHRAAAGPPPAPDDAALITGAEVAVEDDGGWPLEVATRASVRLLPVPPDIDELRRAEPARAAAWRSAVRAAMLRAMEDGLVATSMTATRSYLLEAP